MTSLLQPNKEPKELRPRAAVMAVAVVALFLLILGRLYYLQLVRGDELSEKSRDNYVKELVEPADRGKIFDRRGRILADNRPSFDVYLTPAFCKRPDDVLGRLAVHLALTPEEVETVFKAVKGSRRLERFRPYLVKLDITREQLDVIEADEARLEGVDMIPSPHRDYCPLRLGVQQACDGPLLAHVVGYMSEVSPAEFEKSKGKYRRGDFIGRRGLERSLENELRGTDGKVRIGVDAKGRRLDRETSMQLITPEEARIASVPGHNVVLSIDLGLQYVADQAMREGGQAGAVVAVDVNTGYVLAMVSHPAYDPNQMTGRVSRKDLQAIVNDPLEPLFQRAVQQHYHPGSAFKVVTALAGLAAGVVVPESATSCGGGYSLGQRRWRCHKDSGHGSGINLRRSLVYSCDTYYYWIADKLGLDPIAAKALELGFGKTTGIELAPEAPGLIPTEAFHLKVDKQYTKGFALNAAIGQGSVNVTPLQLAMAYAAIANGGALYRPRLVRRVESNTGEVLKEFQPEVRRQIEIPPAHQAAVMDGLMAVVSEPGGTAYSKRLIDVRVAGKTGTAQNMVIGKERLKAAEMTWAQRDHAWFAAVAPVEAPEIAVVVLNEHGGHGGASAAPIAMAVIQAYFDLKAREVVEGRPPDAHAIAELRPAPRYASQLYAHQAPALTAVAVPMAITVAPGDTTEPVASQDVVADPTLLLLVPKPDDATPGAPVVLEGQPPPE